MTIRIRSLIWLLTGVAGAVVVMWLFGAWRADAADSPPSAVVSITPMRVLDTRSGIGLDGPFTSGTPRALQITGAVATPEGGRVVVPAGATGVVLNVTAVGPTAGGFVSVRPGDATGSPTTSNLNVGAGDVLPNAVTVDLSDNGKVRIWYQAYAGFGVGQTDLLVDVVGYFKVIDTTALESRVVALEANVAELKTKVGTKLDNVSTLTVDGRKYVRFSGVNLQVVAGTNSTNFPTPNGVGNLIVGYNENPNAFPHTGSHNLILGRDQHYTSYGSILGGVGNTSSGPYTALFGEDNTANARGASVSGGQSNTASGPSSSVGGGQGNVASGDWASVAGGQTNTASGEYSSVAGGQGNTASAEQSSVVGGDGVNCADAVNTAPSCGEGTFVLPEP